MKMELPFPVLHSLFLLNQAGYEAYVVGGCVRDALMGNEPTDWDVTTSALPWETLSVFRDYRTIETGIQHGTVTVLVDGFSLEITTYRVDGDYTDGRHPDTVTFSSSLREDLKRRDFTVNAMAFHPQVGLVDLFHGQRDLKRGLIRCVGKPERRFSEDALRILRGLRFSSTLGFSIHPATSKAIHRLARALECVSIERVTVELTKLIGGKDKARVMHDYSDVFSVLIPNVTLAPISRKAVFQTPTSNWAVLMFNLTPDEAEKVCKHLRLSNRISEDIVKLLRYRDIPLEPSRSCILHALRALGPVLTDELINIRTITDSVDYVAVRRIWKQLIENDDCIYQLKDLMVTGEDLAAIGIPIGPEIGTALHYLLAAVMDGICPNEKEKLLKMAVKKPVQ